jgi:hypothetical protein
MKINRRSHSFFVSKKEFEIEKKVVFIFCSFVCVFINSSINNLFVFVFFAFVLSFSISFVWSSAFLNSEKCEFVQEEEKKFLNEKLVIKNDVSNLCKTNSSNFSSLDRCCVEVIDIEKEEKKKRNSFCFEFFVIDFLLSCRQNLQEKSSRKKEKNTMSFEIFNQYRESRLISNESNANLTQKVFAKRKLSSSTSREKESMSVAKEIVQFRFSTTITSLQALQMLSRWLIIMFASEISETLFFDEYNITKFLDRYANLCQNYDLEKKKKIRRLFRYCDFINKQYVRVVINANVFE